MSTTIPITTTHSHHRTDPPQSNDAETMFYTLFNKSNIILLIWFLAIYFIAYFVLGFFFNRSGETSNFNLKLSRTLDIMILFIVLIFFISTYYTISEGNKEDFFKSLWTQLSDYVNDPMSIFSISLFIMTFYIIIFLFRLPMTAETKPFFVMVIENIVWFLFLYIAFVDVFKYVFGVSLTHLIEKLFSMPTALPTVSVATASATSSATVSVATLSASIGNVNISATNEPTSMPTMSYSGTLNIPPAMQAAQDLQGNIAPESQNEVFNISNNLYTYDDAQSICAAYGATLANYDQIEDAYDNGGEWCNYGWSDGQMIFFPTQKATWDKLQKTDKHKNDCGRPGVNGGYMKNPYTKFGVNCYGKKPKPTDEDLAEMRANQITVIPKTADELALDKKVQYWKDNADKLLNINSYNRDRWSEF